MITIKNYIIALLISVASVIMPIATFMLIVGFIIIVDMVTGVAAAFKNNEKITSRKLSNTAIKILIYNLVLISVYFLQIVFFPQLTVNLVYLMSSYLCLIELKSVDENFYKMYRFSFFGYLIKIIKRIEINNNKKS